MGNINAREVDAKGAPEAAVTADKIVLEGIDKCYVCWESNSKKGNNLIRSPCVCKSVVHEKCLIEFIKYKKTFRCSICNKALFPKRKRRMSRRKKLRLAIETVRAEEGASSGCMLTPTCSVFSHFFGKRRERD